MIHELLSSIVALTKTFGLTLQEGADAAKSTGTNGVSNISTDVSEIQKIIVSVSFILALVMITLFNNKVGDKFEAKEKFNGVAWGIGTSVFGVNIILAIYVIIVVVSLYKRIAKIKDKKYAEYAKREMMTFIITYCICAVVNVIAIIYIFQTG